MMGLFLVLSFLISPHTSWGALPNPAFTFDMAPFKAAGNDLEKLKALRTQVCHQYFDKYFEVYSKENKIDLVYTQLTYLKNRVRIRFAQEKFVQNFVPVSVEQTVASFKKIADEAVEEFERSGRLVIGQKQTANDLILKEIKQKFEESEKANQDMIVKVDQFDAGIKKSLRAAVKNDSLEEQTSTLMASFKKNEYILYGVVGVCILNILLALYIYRQIT